MRSIGFICVAVIFLLVLITFSDARRPSFGKGKFKPGKGKPVFGKGKPGHGKGKPGHGKGKPKPPYYKSTTTASPGSGNCDPEAIKYETNIILVNVLLAYF